LHRTIIELIEKESDYYASNNSPEAKTALKEQYAQANKRFPDYTSRLSDRVEIIYERWVRQVLSVAGRYCLISLRSTSKRDQPSETTLPSQQCQFVRGINALTMLVRCPCSGKGLINELQKKKAKVTAAKAVMLAAKIGLMFAGGANTAILEIAFEMGIELYTETIFDCVLGNVDKLLEMDCSLNFGSLRLNDCPSRVKRTMEGDTLAHLETAVDVYEKAQKQCKPVNMRECGLDRLVWQGSTLS